MINHFLCYNKRSIEIHDSCFFSLSYSLLLLIFAHFRHSVDAFNIFVYRTIEAKNNGNGIHNIHIYGREKKKCAGVKREMNTHPQFASIRYVVPCWKTALNEI